jgi:hypothetical protein
MKSRLLVRRLSSALLFGKEDLTGNWRMYRFADPGPIMSLRLTNNGNGLSVIGDCDFRRQQVTPRRRRLRRALADRSRSAGAPARSRVWAPAEQPCTRAPKDLPSGGQFLDARPVDTLLLARYPCRVPVKPFGSSFLRGDKET